MAKFTQIIGILALLAWTLAGVTAWILVGDGVDVVFKDKGAPQEESANDLLSDQVSVLGSDLRGLSSLLETNLGSLVESISADIERSRSMDAGQAKQLSDQLASLSEQLEPLGSLPAVTKTISSTRRDIDLLLASLQAMGKETSSSNLKPMDPSPPLAENTATAPSETAAPKKAAEQPVAAALESPIKEPAPSGIDAPRKKSFLSFTLPSDDYSFDQTREWAILPKLSRVGFDGSSTLHDFTAVTSNIQGNFVANLMTPQTGLGGSIRVRAASLNSGLEDRDAAMREHLAVEQFEDIRFDLIDFEPSMVDSEAQSLSGLIHGSLTIRGTSREIKMPITMQLDESGRLNIEGQTPLLLSDYKVPVPNKLGVIKMDDQVKMWIALRARYLPRKD